MRVIRIVLAFLLLTLSTCSQKQDQVQFDQGQLTRLFTEIAQQQRGMGSISIFKNGKEVFQNSFGYADLKGNMLASAKTKYRIGSISKSFTAAIIMQLIEEHKLTLLTKLSYFFPEIPNAEQITIEHLLRHRSGLYNYTNVWDFANWMNKSITKAELIEKIVKNGAVFTPGQKAEYINTNYVLLSYIAEIIEKKEFCHLLEERITQPLQLQNTYYGIPTSPVNNEALSYTLLDGWQLANHMHMSIPGGAGAIVSNSTDLNRFYQALFTGKVVSEHSLSEMKKLVDDVGIGLFPMPFKEHSGFGHNGGIDGFQSKAVYFPNENVAIACTLNGVGMSVNEIVTGALSIFFGKSYALPELKTGLKLTSEELAPYVGDYSSSTYPLKITIAKKGAILLCQATGQSFRLEAYDKHKFTFEAAMARLEFIPRDKKMILTQGEGQHYFIKVK